MTSSFVRQVQDMKRNRYVHANQDLGWPPVRSEAIRSLRQDSDFRESDDRGFCKVQSGCFACDMVTTG
jgi:hypothetical protein